MRAVIIIGLLGACAPSPGDVELPVEVADHVPDPVVPADNPMTREAIELGRHLFYDPRLSGSGTISKGASAQTTYGVIENPERVG